MASKADYVRREVAKGQARGHHCHAKGCEKQVPPAYFMCARHWKMVPLTMQRAVWHHYNPGQEKSDAGVTQEYLRATDAAIEYVARLEAWQ